MWEPCLPNPSHCPSPSFPLHDLGPLIAQNAFSLGPSILRNLSLTNKLLNRTCNSVLYRTVQIHDQAKLDKFFRTLSSSPRLAQFIRQLSISGTISPINALEECINLTTLSLVPFWDGSNTIPVSIESGYKLILPPAVTNLSCRPDFFTSLDGNRQNSIFKNVTHLHLTPEKAGSDFWSWLGHAELSCLTHLAIAIKSEISLEEVAEEIESSISTLPGNVQECAIVLHGETGDESDFETGFNPEDRMFGRKIVRLAEGLMDDRVVLATRVPCRWDKIVGYILNVTEHQATNNWARCHTAQFWSSISNIRTARQVQGPYSLDYYEHEMSCHHSGDVWSVTFSPDGDRIVSASDDGALGVWDSATLRPLGEPKMLHDSAVNSVAFSPDGGLIVTGADDGVVYLWDALTFETIGKKMEGHSALVWSVAFSPDGKGVVSASADWTLCLWDIPSCEPIGQALKGHTGEVRSVAYSPDGSKFVSGCYEDGTIRIWDAVKLEQIGKFTGVVSTHEIGAHAPAFSPDGKMIAIGCENSLIYFWDVDTGQTIGDPLAGHTGDVICVAFSPDGQKIVSGSGDRSVRLWDTNTHKPIGSPMQGHRTDVKSVAFSPDGSRIVSGSWDHTVCLWDAVNCRRCWEDFD